MSVSDVRILGSWASPYVMRPRIALNIKSVNYEFLQETFGTKSQLLLESNPVHKKMPVLIHNGKPLCESLIIMEYIDEVWSSGASILRSDPYNRAIERFWAAYLDQKWFPSMRSNAIAHGEEEKKKLIEQLVEVVVLMEDTYGKCSKGKSFFGGDKIGYLDIACGSCLAWLKATEKLSGVKLLDEAKAPGLARWAENFSSHPAVKDLLPEPDRLVEFSKLLKAKYAPARASK